MIDNNGFLNDDDDIQDAYCKLYNFCMKSLECSTKLKANIKKVKLERDELIAKSDEANNLNEKFKNQISCNSVAAQTNHQLN